MEKYCYSSEDNDIFPYSSSDLGEILQEARKNGWEKVYVGVLEPKTFEEYLDVDSIFENMNEAACGDISWDVVDDWPSVNKSAKEKLEELIVKWAEENKLGPTFYGVGVTDEFDTSTEDILNFNSPSLPEDNN